MNKEVFVDCHDIDGNIKKVPASELTFRPSVYGVCLAGDTVLLSRQWEGYDFPGGGIEKHETIIDALKREVWEETGLRVDPLGLVTCETSFFILPYGKGVANCQVIYYAVKKISGELSTEHFDEYEKQYAHMAEWVHVKEIENIQFYNSVDSVRIIKRAINKEYTPL